MALASAHDVLTRENWHSADIRDLVDTSIGACGDGSQFEVQGESCRLDPRRAVALAMALHELSTNAVKYGALSSPVGRVRFSWGRRTVEEQERIELLWQESGGPSVQPPLQRGFGSRLIERGLKHDLGGGVELVFAPDGVRCQVWMPLHSLQEGQGT